MIRTLATLSLLSLAACGVDPEGVAIGDVEALMLEADLDLGSLAKIERCRDGIDNDDDGLVDGKDPDCGGGGLWGGGGGFLGGTDEGTGISNPWNPGEGTLDSTCGQASWTYKPGDGREVLDTVLTITTPCGREGEVTEVVFHGRQIDNFQLAVGEGDRVESLIVQTTDGAAWLAPGPIGNTRFAEERR